MNAYYVNLGGPMYYLGPAGTGCRRLGRLGLTTFLKGEKNSCELTPSGARIAGSASTVTPLFPRSSLPT